MKSTVIAHCSSWYHFLGIYAYLNSQKKTHSAIHIIHEGFFQKKTVIPTHTLNEFSEKLKVYENIDEFRKAISQNDLSREHVTLITTNSHPTKLFSITKYANSIESIQIEEGIGSYGNFKQLVLARLRESKSVKTKLSSLLKTALREIIITATPKDKKTTAFLMFTKDGKEINHNIVCAYREALHQLSAHTHCSNLDVSKLVISSPFSELGMINSKEYVRNLARCVGNITGNVFVKAHPIEDKGKFEKLKVVTDDIPVELLALKNAKHLKEIYCFSSTTIYTCHLLVGITPKRISSLDLFYKNFSPAQKRILDKCCEII